MKGWSTSLVHRILVGLAPLVLAACASRAPLEPVSAPQQVAPVAQAEARQEVADQAAGHALELIGRPYRFGGANPSTGFDCSGLVQFSFRQAGAAVPRSTEGQRRASAPIRIAELRRGDLLFFDQDGEKSSHVGIYVGAGRFVHAPSSGKRVRVDPLDSRYWAAHLSEVRRLILR